MTTLEIIQLTPTERLRVVADDSPECPRGDWHMLTGFVKIEGHGDSRLIDVPAVHEPPIDIAEAHHRFEDAEVYSATANEGRGGWRYPNIGREEEMVVRWARVFHGLVVEYDSEHGGYWFVAGADAATAQTPVDESSRALFYDNWPELEVGSPEHLALQAEVITQEQEVYAQWARGDVYGVIYETASATAPVEWNEAEKVWDLRSPLTEDDLSWDWEEEDALWGIYQSDGESIEDLAKATARENFSLSDGAAEALRGS